MIRTTALWAVVLGLAFYSINNWFRAVLGLIALIAVVEHPDFPKSLFGIQGFNPWNVLLVACISSWLIHRRNEGLTWDLPKVLQFLMITYFMLIIVAFLRASTDLAPVLEFELYIGLEYQSSFMGLFSEQIINCIKWVIPSIMIFDGCRDKQRLREAIIAALSVYFLLSLQIIRWMPLSALGAGEDFSRRAVKLLGNEVGFHRVNLSMMTAGAAWACFFAAPLYAQRWIRMCLYGAGGIISFAMALTGGRMGYATWVVLGAGYAYLRSKAMFFAIPIVALIAITTIPALNERIFAGFDEESTARNELIREAPHGHIVIGGVDLYTVTSGRSFAWPFVWDKVLERPFLGWGRMGMQRSGLSIYLLSEWLEEFPHPHNMYLQWVLDNGFIGAIPIFWFYGFLCIVGLRMILNRDEMSPVAGVALCLMGSMLIAGIGSQTFYPREGAVCMWVAMMLMVRVRFCEFDATEREGSFVQQFFSYRPVRKFVR